MATRNRTPMYRKYRDALRQVRSPPSHSGATASSSSYGRDGGPVIELVSTSLLRSDRRYAPLSTEDPGSSRSHIIFLFYFINCYPVRQKF